MGIGKILMDNIEKEAVVKESWIVITEKLLRATALLLSKYSYQNIVEKISENKYMDFSIISETLSF